MGIAPPIHCANALLRPGHFLTHRICLYVCVCVSMSWRACVADEVCRPDPEGRGRGGGGGGAHRPDPHGGFEVEHMTRLCRRRRQDTLKERRRG